MKKICSLFLCLMMVFSYIPAGMADETNPLPQTPAEYAASDYARYAARMAVGEGHLALIKADGSLAVGGDNTRGQCIVPAELSGVKVKAVAAGSWHTLALSENGRVYAWGSATADASGTIAPVTIPEQVQAVQGSIKLIAAGTGMSAVVTNNNNVIIWGHTTNNLDQVPAGLGNIVAIAISANVALTLDDAGEVHVWGASACTTIPDGLNGEVVAIAAGQWHWLALKKDGTVSITGNSTQINNCQNIKNEADVRAIAGGWQSAMALLADGSVKGWGRTCLGTAKNGIELIPASAGIKAFAATVSGGLGSPAICAMRGDGTFVVAASSSFTGNSAGLSGLTVAGSVYNYDLDPAFDTGTTGYTVNVPNEVSSVNITATTVDTAATLQINGTVATSGSAQAVDNLAVGNNSVDVAVTAIDGTTVKTYTLTIKRAAASQDHGADLSSLSVAGSVYYDLAPAFDAGTTGYTVNVPNEVSSVNITATTADSSATLKINGTAVTSGSAQTVDNLVVGSNAVTVEVTAADGTTVKTYTLTIKRAAASQSNGADLSGLTVAGAVYNYDLAPVFDPGTTGYTVNVPNEVSSVHITATAADTAATLKINGTAVTSGSTQAVGNLVVGSNAVTVEVTAAGGTTVKTYTITIMRAGSGGLPQTPAEYAASDYAQLAARLGGGSNHAAVVMADGAVRAWGDNTYGQLNVPGEATGVKALAAGVNHTLALKEDGTVIAWGDNSYGQCDLPAELAGVKFKAVAVPATGLLSAVLSEDNRIGVWGLNNYNQTLIDQILVSDKTLTSIAMDTRYVLALCDDGTVKAWDWRNSFSPCEAPAGFSGNVVALEAGSQHILALKADGSVVSWGHDGYAYAVPAGLTDARAVSAGYNYSAALTADGNITVWGQNSYNLFTVPADLGRVQALSAGSGSLYALQEDGTIVAWGRNSYGQCDVPAGLNLFSTVSDDNRLASLSVATGDGAACGIYPAFSSEQSEFVADVAYEAQEVRVTAQPFSSKAGLEINGAPAAAGVAAVINAQSLAVGDNTVQVKVKAESGNERSYTLHIKRVRSGYSLPQTPHAYRESELAGYARRLAAGDRHSLAVKKDGAVAAWGNSSNGQCNMPAGLGNVVAVAAGRVHSLALQADGAVVAWGPPSGSSYSDGQCDVPAGLSQAVDISAGSNFSAALTQNGQVYVWGSNTYGQCDLPAGLSNVADIQCGANHILALKADGTVAAWGDNRYGQCDVPAGLSQVVAVAAGMRHSVALQADGALVAWGQTDTGQSFGHPDLQFVKAISAGEDYAAALKWDGSLVVWGSYNGQNVDFGLPLIQDREYLAVSGGSQHLLGLNPDGTVSALGNPLDNSGFNSNGNVSGQCDVPAGLNLFAGDTPYSGPSPDIPQTPAAYAASDYARAAAKICAAHSGLGVLNMDGTVKVAIRKADNLFDGDIDAVPAGLNNVTAIAIADITGMALKKDGTVVVWGYNGDGQCDVPASVRDVTAIAMGNQFSPCCLALKADGAVAAWGGDVYGQCQVPADLANVAAIAVGDKHCLALKADGTVAAWGDNTGGQCDVPAGLNNVARIYAGYNFSLALKNDGTVVAWGSNYNGDSSYYCGQCDVPEGLSGVVDIVIDTNTCVALKNNGTVVVWGDNLYGKRNVPPGLHDVAAVALGDGVKAIRTDGTVVVWGNAPVTDDTEWTGLSQVLTIKNDTIIFRDGAFRMFGDGAVAAAVNAGLAGLNVLSGHYFAVNKAELLNPAGQSISSVPGQGGYRIKTFVGNNNAVPTAGLTIIQVRGGSGAASSGGGQVLGCVGLAGDIPVAGSSVSADFTMPSGVSGPAYVDVFVWDGWDTMVPRAAANQSLSFGIDN
ncbi:Cadherin-like beta sandwich domain protein [Pelotomaculum schinkii]|uniref:Cadherin-like beta sandwich domain protein n=1 Tax=Pelotomaculum schinkii TaxID=78350 RepID=A0A4Y7RG70_9FIRM|nr:cadherin-like beta sandwich domain-containing protein [Pelotomaculum schinkii]TEB08015.1 Cadherin-like beta sandwich domain protein [Pelotomaculum schinkii]